MWSVSEIQKFLISAMEKAFIGIKEKEKEGLFLFLNRDSREALFNEFKQNYGAYEFSQVQGHSSYMLTGQSNPSHVILGILNATQKHYFTCIIACQYVMYAAILALLKEIHKDEGIKIFNILFKQDFALRDGLIPGGGSFFYSINSIPCTGIFSKTGYHPLFLFMNVKYNANPTLLTKKHIENIDAGDFLMLNNFPDFNSKNISKNVFFTTWNRDNVFCAKKNELFYGFGSDTGNLKLKAEKLVFEYNKVSDVKKNADQLLEQRGFINDIYHLSENLLRPLTGTIVEANNYVAKVSQHTQSVKNEVNIIRENANNQKINATVSNNTATNFYKNNNYDAALEQGVLALLALDKDIISCVKDGQQPGQSIDKFKFQEIMFHRATNHFIVGRCYQKKAQPDLLSAHRHFVLALQFHRDFLYPDQQPTEDWKKSLAKYELAIKEVLRSLQLA